MVAWARRGRYYRKVTGSLHLTRRVSHAVAVSGTFHPPPASPALGHGLWHAWARGPVARREAAGRPGQPAGAAAAALSRPRQARRPPVHERRTVARRYLRSEAASRAPTRQAAAAPQPAHRAQ